MAGRSLKTPTNFNKAIAYYQASIGKYGPSNPFKNHIYANLGGLYFNNNLYPEALKYYTITINNDPTLHSFRYGLAQICILLENFQEAHNHLNYIISYATKDSDLSRAYRLRGLLWLWTNDPEKAILDYSKAIKITADKKHLYHDIGVAYGRAENYNKAKLFLKKSIKAFPNDISMQLSLLEVEVREGDKDMAVKVSEHICRSFSYMQIKQAFKNIGIERYRSVPRELDKIKPYITDALGKLKVDFAD